MKSLKRIYIIVISAISFFAFIDGFTSAIEYFNIYKSIFWTVLTIAFFLIYKHIYLFSHLGTSSSDGSSSANYKGKVTNEFKLSILGTIGAIWIAFIFNHYNYKYNEPVELVTSNSEFVFESEAQLNVLLLPFNYTRECSNYDSKYEESFVKRLENLTYKHGLEINTKIAPCIKYEDEVRIDSLLMQYKLRDPNSIVHNYVVGAKSKANVVIYGLYEEDCADTTFINVKSIYISKENLRRNLISNNKTSVEVIDSFLLSVNQVFSLPKFKNNFFPTRLSNDLNKNFVAIERVYDIREPDYAFSTDKFILTIFSEFYAESNYDRFLSLAKEMRSLDTEKFRIEYWNRRILNTSRRWIGKYFDEKKYYRVSDILENINLDSLSQFNYAYFNIANVSQLLERNKYAQLFQHLRHMRKVAFESSDKYTAFIHSSWFLFSKIGSEENVLRNMDGIEYVINESIEAYANLEYVTNMYYRELNNHIPNCSKYFKDGDLMPGMFKETVKNYQCFKAGLLDSNYLSPRLKMDFSSINDIINRFHAVEAILEQRYSDAILFYNKIETKLASDHIMVSGVYHNMRKYKLSEKAMFRGINVLDSQDLKVKYTRKLEYMKKNKPVYFRFIRPLYYKYAKD